MEERPDEAVVQAERARLRPMFDPGATYVPDDGLARSLGVDRVWDAGDATGGRLILSMAPKDGAVPTEFGSYLSFVDRSIGRRLSERELELMSVDPDNPAVGKLRDAGVPWAVLAFTRDQDADASVRGSICDSAALIMDFGYAYWTLSWNADRGTLGDTERAIEAFLATMRLTGVDES